MKNVKDFLMHPVVLVSGGVVIGLVFGQRLRQLPGVNKIPNK